MSDDLDAIRAQFGVDVDAPLHTYRGAMGRLFGALDAVTAERDAIRNAYSDSERYRQEDRDELERLRTENELLRAGEAQAIGESEVE